MKASFILAIPALALTASAEPIPRMKRDDAASLSTVADRISDAMVRLDEEVKPFGDDAVPVLKGVRELIETIENSTKQVADMSNPVPVNDITNLPKLLTMLQTSGKTLLKDLSEKKTQVEKARICGPASAQMLYVETLSGRLIDATLRKLPQPAQAILKTQTEGLSQIIREGAAVFGPSNCRNLVVAPTAPALPTDGADAFPTVDAPPADIPAPTDGDTFPTVAPPAKRGGELPEAGTSYVAEPIPTTTCTEEEPSTTISTTQTKSSTATVSLSTTVSTATVSVYPTTSSEITTVPTTVTSIDTTECDEETVAPSTTSTPEVTIPTTVTSVDTTECEEEETPVPTPPPSTPEYPPEVPTSEVPSSPIPTESSYVPEEPSIPPYPTTSQVHPTGGYPIASTTAPPSPIATAAAADIRAPIGLAALAAAMLMF